MKYILNLRNAAILLWCIFILSPIFVVFCFIGLMLVAVNEAFYKVWTEFTYPIIKHFKTIWR